MPTERLQEWYDIEDDVIILTGGAGRLGRHYGEVLSELGANVVLFDLDGDQCRKLASSLGSDHGTDPLGIEVDLREEDDVQAGVEQVVDKYGRVDTLINNAAAEQLTVIDGEVVGVSNFPKDLWEENLDVNLTGALLCVQEVAPHMLDEDSRGVILNIGSVYGVQGPDQRIYGDSGINSSIAYATTKSGLVNFTRYLASFYQGEGIRVNCLSPGGVRNEEQTEEFRENYTDRTMIKRMAEPDDLAAALVYLISPASSWVTGYNMVVDGGWTAW